MDTITTIVEREMAGYARHGLNGYSYLISDRDHQAYTVISIGYVDNKRLASADLIVRIIGEQVIVDHDDNYPPLVETLIDVGLSRDQIILAYAGEPVPEVAL